MDSSPLRSLVLLVVALAAFGAARAARRGHAGDRPWVALLGALAACGALALALRGGAASALATAVVAAGFALAVVPGWLERAALRARLHGRYARAFRLARVLRFVRPTAHAAALARVLGVVARADAGAVTARAAGAELREVRDVPDGLVEAAIFEASAAVMATRGAWGALAATHHAADAAALGRPGRAAEASYVVRALCECGRLREAAEVVGHMERAAEAAASPSEAALPEEWELFHHRARVTLLAFAGRWDAVRDALGARSAWRALFSRDEAAALRARARGEPAAAAAADGGDGGGEVAAVLARVEAAVARERGLPNAFSTWRAVAPATGALALANVAAYAAAELTGGTAFPERLMQLGGATREHVLGAGEAWRLVASAFLHAGPAHVPLHVLLNVSSLVAIGGLVEREMRPLAYVALYLVAAVTGALAHVLWGSDGVLVGASGAVFGVLGALAVLARTAPTRWPPRLVRRLRGTLVPVLAVNLYLSVALPFVSFAAHGGGFVAGAALAGGWARWLRPRTGRDERAGRRARIAAVGGAVAAALVLAWAARGVHGSLAKPLGEVVPMRVAEATIVDVLGRRATVRLAHPATWALHPRGEGGAPLFFGPRIVGASGQLVSTRARCGDGGPAAFDGAARAAPWGRGLAAREEPDADGRYVMVYRWDAEGALELRYYVPSDGVRDWRGLLAGAAARSGVVGCRAGVE